ncbi:hypothetical protein MMC10_010563 [Thelotrema lepadinum]|nr:hypothetical protein [Thelotrema lepadinum]
METHSPTPSPSNLPLSLDLELAKPNTHLLIILDLDPSTTLGSPIPIPGSGGSQGQTVSSLLDISLPPPPRPKPKPKPPSPLLPRALSPLSPEKTAANTAPKSPPPPTPVVAGYILHVLHHNASLLTHLFTHPRYRRRGLASSLLSHLTNELEEEGVEKCQLWVESTAREARRVLKGVGFREREGGRDYFGRGRNGWRVEWVGRGGGW